MIDPYIFNKNIRTKLRILSIIENTSQWYSAEKLSALTSIEKKTILKYCKELAEDSEKFAKGDLQILISKSQGIFLEAKNKNILSQFKVYLLEDTLTIKLMRRFFSSQPNNLTQLEQEFFVSESTIKRKIRSFRKNLAPYGIQIIYKNGSYELIGSESQIRMYFLISTWMTFKGSCWPFPTLKEEKINRTINDILALERLNSSDLSETDKRLLSYSLAIIILRYHQGKMIDWRSEWNVYEEVNHQLQLDSALKEYLLSDNEINFFLIVLQTFVKTYDFPELSARFIEAHKKYNTPAYEASKDFFHFFKQRFEIPVDDDLEKSTMGYFIACHLFTDIFKGFPIGIIGYDITTETKASYPFAANEVYQLIDDLQAHTNLALFREREQLHMRYTLFLISIEQLSKFEPPITIYFESDLPVFAEQRVKQRISSIFINWYHIHFVKNASEEHDLIIATSSAPNTHRLSISGKPVVFINQNLSYEDFFALNSVLKELHSTRRNSQAR
ncbi:helix-turn-helix domain-containing protein [Enterococcus sp. AZ196]|uniref:helix-turn-helix domain-containing protein n=1 Tax=Enterococcus sp. AZ196 TaxID=2774659 RepID=UPI003D267D49